MAQNSKNSGLNLDPMYFWRYVMLDKHRIIPKAIIMDGQLDKTLGLAEQNRHCEFLLLTNELLQDLMYPNVKILWSDSLESTRLYKVYSSADYLLANEKDKDLWLPAMFCGVSLAYTFEQLQNMVKRKTPLEMVERVNNWEKAENLLTSLSISDIKEV